MDVWAPSYRHFRGGVTDMTNVLGSIVANAGANAYTASGAATDSAAHATPGDVWLNAYGECLVTSNSTAGSKVGFLFRYVDTSNYYAAYSTSTGAAVDSVVGGVPTNILAVTYTLGTFSFVAPATFRAEIFDDAITLSWRGAVVGGVQTTALTSPGLVCLLLRGETSANNAAARQFETGPFAGSYAPPLNQQPGPRRTPSRLR